MRYLWCFLRPTGSVDSKERRTLGADAAAVLRGSSARRYTIITISQQSVVFENDVDAVYYPLQIWLSTATRRRASTAFSQVSISMATAKSRMRELKLLAYSHRQYGDSFRRTKRDPLLSSRFNGFIRVHQRERIARNPSVKEVTVMPGSGVSGLSRAVHRERVIPPPQRRSTCGMSRQWIGESFRHSQPCPLCRRYRPAATARTGATSEAHPVPERKRHC